MIIIHSPTAGLETIYIYIYIYIYIHNIIDQSEGKRKALAPDGSRKGMSFSSRARAWLWGDLAGGLACVCVSVCVCVCVSVPGRAVCGSRTAWEKLPTVLGGKIEV